MALPLTRAPEWQHDAFRKYTQNYSMLRACQVIHAASVGWTTRTFDIQGGGLEHDSPHLFPLLRKLPSPSQSRLTTLHTPLTNVMHARKDRVGLIWRTGGDPSSAMQKGTNTRTQLLLRATLFKTHTPIRTMLSRVNNARSLL